ncbi:MAG TPA: hypothetical protein VKU61_13310 [Candidatus Binatia bacterium]|nr:hypothetical protein [Candidatus Binatia bacterium]
MKTMKATWLGSIVAVGAAAMLIGAGIALAKSENGGHAQGSHGHGGPHGGPGDNVGGGHGHGGGHGNGGGHGSGNACDAASSTIGAFIDATCPCAGVDDGNGGTVAWKNHGQYVRCVAHAARAAARAAGVKRRCARALVPCAARSSCGKKNAVACIVPSVGTCTGGACSNDPETPCAVDADCTLQACTVTSADRCAAAGGSASSGSCCLAASPSGAFVDGPLR